MFSSLLVFFFLLLHGERNCVIEFAFCSLWPTRHVTYLAVAFQIFLNDGTLSPCRVHKRSQTFTHAYCGVEIFGTKRRCTRRFFIFLYSLCLKRERTKNEGINSKRNASSAHT
ncbi:unnamed protein product [Ixodes pacificus]